MQISTPNRRLLRLVRDAKTNVPLYRRLYSDVSTSNNRLSPEALLENLPIVTKEDLLRVSSGERINQAYDPADLIAETTTGSSGQPFTVFIDSSYIRRRNLRFLRGLLSVGFRPWQRLMLLTDRFASPNVKNLNRHYVSISQPTAGILEAYLQICPHVLYGLLTPLKLLAEQVRRMPQRMPKPNLVISTAEVLDPGTRDLLQKAFGCPVADFYGMTEMGLVAWRRPGAKDYRVLSKSVIMELIPRSSTDDSHRMVITNLDLRSSPLIRYESGDLARVSKIDGKPAIVAIEGRSIDQLVGSDGAIVSPYAMSIALQKVPGLKQFRVVQTDLRTVEISLDAGRQDAVVVEREVREVVSRLLGPDVNIQIEFGSNLVAEGARKFRPIESLVGRT